MAIALEELTIVSRVLRCLAESSADAKFALGELNKVRRALKHGRDRKAK